MGSRNNTLLLAGLGGAALYALNRWSNRPKAPVLPAAPSYTAAVGLAEGDAVGVSTPGFFAPGTSVGL